MAEIDLGATHDGPGMHALVIGVSHYPYLSADADTQAARDYGLEDLTSAARSASEVAAWLLNEYRNPDAPLVSLRVLLSPAPGETLADGIVPRLPASYAATREAVERDLMAFRATMAPRPTLMFNVPSEFNGWWHDEGWKRTFDYTTETGTEEEGLTITLEAR